MSDRLAAFAVRGDDRSIAGTVSVGDGETFDVGAALDEGEGTIVVLAGSKLDYSLQGFGALKSVEVPDGAVAVNAGDEGGTVNATDAAISKAAELGVDLDTVEGTGKDGSIKVSDVEEAAQKAAAGDEGGTGDESEEQS